LRQFQADQVFVSADGRSSQAASGATAGLVRPNDLTWQRLVAATPPALADLRVLAGGATVYLAALAADLASALTAAGAMTFEPLDGVKQHGRSNDNHLGRLAGG